MKTLWCINKPLITIRQHLITTLNTLVHKKHVRMNKQISCALSAKSHLRKNCRRAWHCPPISLSTRTCVTLPTWIRSEHVPVFKHQTQELLGRFFLEVQKCHLHCVNAEVLTLREQVLHDIHLQEIMSTPRSLIIPPYVFPFPSLPARADKWFIRAR